ncbi:MAG: DUF5694 domain-containing protein [Dokdonella sp.]
MLGAALALSGVETVHARVDLSTLDKGMGGPRSQLLVLGSAHLSNMPKTFKPESLQPVIDRLAAYKPDVITIEAIAGEGCDLAARHSTRYRDVLAYCRDTAEAKAATGLDVVAAIVETNTILKDWPAKPTAAQRRHLAAVFLAANESASALVQWLQLPESERHAGDGLDDALVKSLGKIAASNNENYLIAARLAARLELQRVYPIDDHTGDNVEVADGPAFEKAVQQAWATASPQALAMRKREEQLSGGTDMLALYRYVNDPANQWLAIDSDFGAAMRGTSPQHYSQLYVAGWETRNLRMAANIRAAFREHPGARVLSIIGSSHKPWIDNLLALMLGVDIVDAERVLK